MTTIALFHSVLGVRPGVLAAAEVFRAAGHQVRVIDTYDGRVFDDYDEASAFAQSIGYPTLMDGALAAVADQTGWFVTAGFSMGAILASTSRTRVVGAAEVWLVPYSSPVRCH